MSPVIRPATIEDVAAIRNIVNYNITHTTGIYDYNEKSETEMQQWFADKQLQGWPVLVADAEGAVAGYATYGTFRVKDGFRPTVEHSVYVHHEYQGRGIGGRLLEQLIATARAKGYHMMVGCIDAENRGSINFHRKFGFTDAGLLKEAAFKFDRWLDLQFLQLILEKRALI